MARPKTRKPPKPKADLTARQHIAASPQTGASERRKAFARCVFAGMTNREAWLKIHGWTKPRHPVNDTTQASRLRRHPKVVAELERLAQVHAAELAAKAKQVADDRATAEAAAIATREEVLRFHTAVLRASSSEITAETKHLIHTVETKRLAPPKYDKDGEEIPNPDADREGYITDLVRRPPDLKERIKAADSLTAMQAWAKPDPSLAHALDPLAELLREIRGGGKA